MARQRVPSQQRARAGSRGPARVFRRWSAAGLIIVLWTGLVGCQRVDRPSPRGQEGELRGRVVLAMGIPTDEKIDTELSEGLKGRLKITLREFQLIHPQAQVQLQLFPEDQLLQELWLRNLAGTGPDLLFVNDHTAAKLHHAGLTRTVPLPGLLLKRMGPVEARRIRSANGELISLPVLLLPQLACFDQRRLKRPPADLADLLRLSNQGLRVGLPLDGFNLAWTFGSLGILGTMEELASGQPATPERRAALARWLAWMKQADQVLNVSFELSQSQLIEDLSRGELDWTSCRSTNLARLTDELGPNLGIALLPAGPGGAPSPLSRQRVLAFGRNSSPSQQQVAEAFARFILTPITQRNLALQRGALPVLGTLRIPKGRKGTLQLLTMAQSQMRKARATPQLLFPHDDPEGNALGRVLSRYLYGDLDEASAIDALVRAVQPGGRRQ